MLVALLLICLPLGACSSKKSDAELASEALARGLAAHQAGKLAEAEADYRKVLVYDPNNKFAYYNLGLIDQTDGALASAESNYRLALGIDPTFVSALFNLAIVKTAQGNLGAAIELYRSAIAADPTNAPAHLNLGFALIQKGAKKVGQEELDTAIRLDPSLASRLPGQPVGTGSSQPSGRNPTSTPRGSATPSA
jgi:tetratricopeptide (TPR) repeat protein